jgi:hypothetical protein
VQEFEQFFTQRVTFSSEREEGQEEDGGELEDGLLGVEHLEEDKKFMRFLESAANGQITVQDLHAFSM